MIQASQTGERAAVAAAVAAVRGGDREAFATVVEAYHRRIFALLLMTIRDRAGAEDVMQEAFLRAFTRLELYDPQRDFYPWLATIAVRLAQNWVKRHAAVRAHERDAELAEQRPSAHSQSSTAPDTLGELMEDDRARRLWSQVASLPQRERMAVFLHYREDLSVAEVAQALGIASGTVKTMLFRARKKLEQIVDAP